MGGNVRILGKCLLESYVLRSRIHVANLEE
jgi:hypothetical protein